MRALLRAFPLALALLPASGAPFVYADDGRPQSHEVGHPPSQSPIPQSRLSHAATPSPAVISSEDVGEASEPHGDPRKELIVFVGGYGSSVNENDAVCAELRTWFAPGHYEVACFGDDPAFPYDTYGPIDASARTLIGEIRAHRADYSGVNIIAHSMGGTVADMAFADGLSAGDGVKVSIEIAAPHSGSKFARVPTKILPEITPVADIVRAEAVRYARDPSSAAARDLASFRPKTPPQAITRLDISLATDVVVSQDDARDPGIQERVFLPASVGEVEGHGGVLRNREVRALVIETIASHRVPVDDRGAVTLLLVPLLTPIAQHIAWVILGVLVMVCSCLAMLMRMPACRPVLRRMHAGAVRFLRAHGR